MKDVLHCLIIHQHIPHLVFTGRPGDCTCNHNSHKFSQFTIESGKGSADWHMTIFDRHLQKLLWIDCSGQAVVKANN